jgi:hypothetical protein
MHGGFTLAIRRELNVLPPSGLPNGDHNPELVCRGCEDFFSETDDYAK